MRVVFDLADTITVLVYGQVIASGSAGGNPRQSRGAGSLSGGAGGMMLEVQRSARVLWQEPHPAGRQPVGRRRRDRQPARPQRRRPVDHLQGDHGPGGAGRHGALSRPRHRRAARQPGGAAGIGYVPEDRQIFPTLTVRQNLMLGLKRAGRFGRWNFDDVFRLFPNLAERQNNSGRRAVRRRAADADHVPHADGRSGPDPDR